MNGDLKKLYTDWLAGIKERNQLIIVMAYKADKTYREISKEFGLSCQRIKQILATNKVSVPMKKGYIKYDVWRQRISAGKMGKPSKLKGKKRVKKDDNQEIQNLGIGEKS